MGQFIGEQTRVVGIHAHNPLGISFATDIYPTFYGRTVEPINATEFRRMIEHPALRQHRCHLKVIVGGPGAWQIEKKNLQDTKDSLDLLFALKDAKWCVIPTLFVPLEDMRMAGKSSAKLFDLTDLQWEFFFTCWCYNLDFWRRGSVHWRFNMGIPIYYYLLRRKLFGSAMKYPIFRLGHFPEWFLRRKLYLDFSKGQEPRYRVPEHVPVPEHRRRPELPLVLPETFADETLTMQNGAG
jgi:hypothetical protein